MRNLYRKLIQYSVEQRIKRYKNQGKNYNREKIVREMEATNSITIFLLFQILVWLVDETFKLGIYALLFPYMRLFFIALILMGLNHYFGWIKLKK